MTTPVKNLTKWVPGTPVGVGNVNLKANDGTLLVTNDGKQLITNPTYAQGKFPTTWTQSGA